MENLATTRIAASCTLALAITAPLYASAELTDGVAISERFFNDFSTTTLTTTDNFPAIVAFNESGYADDGIGGNWANRHDAMISMDGGATATLLNLNDGFSVSANVTMNVGSAAPRKEAGIRVNSGITGDALFLINSDAGEIVAFGGGAPFFIFGSNGGGDGYTLGDTIFMQMTYTPSGSFGVPGKVEYVIDRGNGLESSGLLDWSNLEGGPLQYNVGFYTQISPDLNNSAEFANVSFEDIRVTPEPSALALLGLGIAGLVRRHAA
ncbi:PEP-CTERM sorting domain-containing protein [Mucisphaera calidilacus]|uniref:Ice-binding protein C-terminal domain-containing protein n=1 Tax=Mucisphaera calidilacus TaxID=2527982 RepID=A0A518BUL8_9BACT|nr:PEP-CTERM sorting domain-containing protein [Mucisphaera calidilacus]QDU70685.1 hypothetical protein Pan265_05150 [Mucisphaera calidilacus]